MSYGKMNSFIDLIATTTAKDDEGFGTGCDEVLASVRAYREGRHGSQKWANRAAFSEATDLFRFRNAGGTVYEMVVAFVTISNYKITGITKAISETQYLKDGLTTYTHSRSGTVHSLIGTGCNLRFRATADFVNGDTFSVNGTTVTASTPNKETVVNAFKADSMVTAQLNGSTLTLYSDAQTSANTAITNAATAQSTANNHIANKSNPHGVTKSQVGLSKVANVTTTMGYDGNLWISYS